MDRGAWWPIVHGVAKESGHQKTTKQQEAIVKYSVLGNQ